MAFLLFTDIAMTSYQYYEDFDVNQVHYWLDDVECTGNESYLIDCQHGPLGVHDCAKHERVAIICKFIWYHYVPNCNYTHHHIQAMALNAMSQLNHILVG